MFLQESTRSKIEGISKMIESDKPVKSTVAGRGAHASLPRRGFLKRLTAGGVTDWDIYHFDVVHIDTQHTLGIENLNGAPFC